MRKPFARILIFTFIFCLAAGQAAAFDLQIGHLDFGSPSADSMGPSAFDNSGFGAMVTIPFDASGSGAATTTLNGRDISQFTQQDAKDSLIVIMLFSVAIALGVLSANAVAE
jgi:hypothetical protein